VLDVVLDGVSFAYSRSGFGLRDLTLTFKASTHTAVAGLGSSTLLKLIAGHLRPQTGRILIGTRDVTDIRTARRPLLYVTARPDVPGRWSVQHALIAAVRQRTLDRVDRQHEYDLAAAKWGLEAFLSRRTDTLSSSEQVRLFLARIELLRPGILVADRVLTNAAALADDFYRTLRVIGTTVISAPASPAELGFTDQVVVLAAGRVAQSDSVRQLYAHPADENVAAATGEVNIVPITVRGGVVDSAIGSWDADGAPFEGGGVALVRPDDFVVAAPGEESDLIISVEEASFDRGQWLVRAIVSGGLVLLVRIPRQFSLHKGKLVALRYDPRRFSLIPRDIQSAPRGVPTDVVPPMSETR
jgi:ABC-type Fe3+/spermidine/putrescine transport system ATPase subunit